jgi:hypothetical protein
MVEKKNLTTEEDGDRMGCSPLLKESTRTLEVVVRPEVAVVDVVVVVVVRICFLNKLDSLVPKNCMSKIFISLNDLAYLIRSLKTLPVSSQVPEQECRML